MVSIRPYAPADLDALHAICLATGDSGEDATALYRDPKIIGEIYAAPYARLAPELAFVAEDGEGVAGYVLGVPETASWEARLEREWWPALRRMHADPGAPRADWSADEMRAWQIHHPVPTPEDVVRAFPGHLHLDLFPRAQGRGVGTRLLEAWLGAARARGARAAHVGVGTRNARGLGFWRARGFADIPGAANKRTTWLGRAV